MSSRRKKQNTQNKLEQAIAVIRQQKRNDYELIEFKKLISSAGYNVASFIVQVRPEDSKFNIGKGKIPVLKDLIAKFKPNKVIFGNELKPSQFVNLLKELNIEEDKLIDRILLVLEIFEKRAGTIEAKLQVELARAIYRKNILKEIIKERKKREKPGFHGLGRYPIDVYQKEITKRITVLKRKLAKVKKHRELHRLYRRKKGYFLVSIVGYTNAGKSTLLNSLTKSSVPVSNKMFTTLSTYSRKIINNKATSEMTYEKSEVILVDTIGFVYNIPPFLIEAFKSTLEEVSSSDLIIYVVDASEDVQIILEKIKTCNKIINEIGATDIPRILVFNKIDKIDKSALNNINQLKDYLSNFFEDTILVSAKFKINIDNLKEKIEKILLKKKHPSSIYGKIKVSAGAGI
ncbi:MAG: GTPase HflX [Candidatus Asgardarchaeia archaeon]